MLSPKLGYLLSASLLGIISGTSTSTAEVLLPTTKELVTFPYPITLATTLNDFVSPEFRLTVHVIVRVIGLYTPPSAEISSKPSPKTSQTATLTALDLPTFVMLTVYVTSSPKLGFSMSAVLLGIISGTVMFTELVLFPTVTLLVKTP